MRGKYLNSMDCKNQNLNKLITNEKTRKSLSYYTSRCRVYLAIEQVTIMDTSSLKSMIRH